MIQDIGDLLVEFDDLTDDVSRSKQEFFAPNLRRWLTFLDSTPEIASVVRNLEDNVNFEEWRKEGLIPQRGMGHGRIIFPDVADKRLGIQIALFRSLTQSERNAWQFAHTYVSSARNINENIADLVDQVFGPFARDLRRKLERSARADKTAPAADRVVPLDHNNPAYAAAIGAINDLAEALRSANDYNDADDKDQKVTEIAAGQELLKAKRVSLKAVFEVLAKPIRDLIKKFYDQGLGRIASSAWAKLQELLPPLSSFFDGS